MRCVVYYHIDKFVVVFHSGWIMKADIRPEDRGETVSLMEPLLLGGSSRHREMLADLALDLAQKSAGFKNSLPPSLLTSLATLVRAMNCYYSNLIEGHDTHPIDIERALKDEFSQDAHKRDLQLEAKAHIHVQRWIDEGGLKSGKASSVEEIKEIHRRFCELLPEDLLWVHPFLDGNGRVARLMSHAMLLGTLDTGAVWSVARGLARNVHEYKTLLANCDLPRRNDLDGRGNLGEEALAEFTRFFLTVCIDQVNFMEGLMQPDRLRTRILLWAEEEIRLGLLPPKSGAILGAILYRGELPRGEADTIVGTGERQARRIVSALIEHGVLESETPRGPLRLTFPAALGHRWMPGLFPEKVG